MTQLILNIEQPAVLKSLKKIVSIMDGVTIAKPTRMGCKMKVVRPKAKKADPTCMTKEEYFAMLDQRIAQAEEDRRQGRLITMGENETGEEFINRLLCM